MANHPKAPAPQFNALAENYPLDQIAYFKTQHPDHISRVSTHQIIVGSAGTGKSMLMKQICYAEKYERREFLPVYIVADTLSVGKEALSAADAGAEERVTGLLATVVMLRVVRILRTKTKAISAVMRSMPESPMQPEAAEQWLQSQRLGYISLLRGQRATGAFHPPPDFRTFLESLSIAMRDETGLKPLFLFDALDNLDELVLRAAGGAFGRTGNYTTIMAVRPSPQAPSSTVLPVESHDVLPHWIGRDWTVPGWSEFLLESARPVFSARTLQALEQRVGGLAEIVGPNLRDFLRIADQLDREPIPSAAAVDQLFTKVIREVGEGHQQQSKSGMRGLESSTGFIANLRHDLKSDNGIHGLVDISPDGGRLYLEEKTQQKIRVAVREGVLVPLSPEAYGLDDASAESYRVVPIAVIAPSKIASTPINDVVVQIEERAFRALDERHGPPPPPMPAPSPFAPIYFETDQAAASASPWLDSLVEKLSERGTRIDLTPLILDSVLVREADRDRKADSPSAIFFAADGAAAALEMGRAIGDGRSLFVVGDTTNLGWRAAQLLEKTLWTAIDGRGLARLADELGEIHRVPVSRHASQARKWIHNANATPLNQIDREAEFHVVIGPRGINVAESPDDGSPDTEVTYVDLDGPPVEILFEARRATSLTIIDEGLDADARFLAYAALGVFLQAPREFVFGGRSARKRKVLGHKAWVLGDPQIEAWIRAGDVVVTTDASRVEEERLTFARKIQSSLEGEV